jgi:hypothetical protein
MKIIGSGIVCLFLLFTSHPSVTHLLNHINNTHTNNNHAESQQIFIPLQKHLPAPMVVDVRAVHDYFIARTGANR